jgi:predicted dehydrogenase
MMNEIRVGIIGFGRIGAEHAGWLKLCEQSCEQSPEIHKSLDSHEERADIRAAAIADATPARQEIAREKGLHVHASTESLLADESIDAILVATPTAMHFDHAMAALRAGKHVMVEKPMAMNLAHATQMTNLAKSQNRILSVFHNRRWDRDFLTVQSSVASGTFGKIINIESRLGQWASCVGPAAKQYRPGWRNEAAFGGGGLFDWGSHFIDQLWRLMQPSKPVRVFAQLRGNVWSTDCDDFARVCIDFDNGAVGLMEINTTTTKPLPRWHIDGTKGSAESPHSLDFDVQKWAELDFLSADSGKQSQRLPLAPAGLSEVAIWKKFAEAIHGAGEPAVTAESVLPTMLLLDAARESSRVGKVIDVRQIGVGLTKGSKVP